MRHSSRLVPALLVLASCGLALAQGLTTTRGLRWPFDEDLFRDIAQAQTMADGGWLSDPFYLGESLWYNPLVPAAIAVGSKILGVPPNEASLRLGPWLGLVGPLAFFVLVAALIGRWGAVAALLLFIFVTPGHLPALQCATYSPWPFAAQVAQGPFFLGLAALVAALARPGFGRFVLVGVCLGLTFLAHTGPALLLGAISGTLLLLGPSGPGANVVRRLIWLSALIGSALTVASPLLWSILGRYHLKVLNPEPGAYVWRGTGLESLEAILVGALARPVLVGLVLLGVGELMMGRPQVSQRPEGRRVILAWIAWGTALLAYALVQPGLADRGLSLPPLVPAFHFWALLGALASLLAADAIAWLGSRLASLWRTKASRQTSVSVAVTLGLGLAMAAAHYPSWRTRWEFTQARRVADFHGSCADRVAAHEWVRGFTRRNDVFLAEHDPGLRVVATAGRKLVAVDSGFSSPFVLLQPRTEAAERMLAALHPGGHETFHPLAVAYRVNYVLYQRRGPDEPFPDAPFLRLAWKDGDFAIYRTECWPDRDAAAGR